MSSRASSLIIFAFAGFFSIMSALPTPRDTASKDIAPVPAKTSIERSRPSLNISQLKTVSRMRSVVGRRPGAERTFIFLPLRLPPIIRISCDAPRTDAGAGRPYSPLTGLLPRFPAPI